jgi:hypothetical protein
VAASIYKRGTILHAQYYHIDKLPDLDVKPRYVVVVSDETYHADKTWLTVVKLSHSESDDSLLPDTIHLDDLKGTGLTNKDGEGYLHTRSLLPMPLDWINQRKGNVPTPILEKLDKALKKYLAL